MADRRAITGNNAPRHTKREKMPMQYDKAKWVAAVQKAIADLKTDKPTAGKVCSVATLRYVRDGLLADFAGLFPKDKETQNDCENAIKDSLNELIKQVSTDTDSGFASNSSAAAKAAGHKAEATSLASALEE